MRRHTVNLIPVLVSGAVSRLEPGRTYFPDWPPTQLCSSLLGYYGGFVSVVLETTGSLMSVFVMKALETVAQSALLVAVVWVLLMGLPTTGVS